MKHLLKQQLRLCLVTDIQDLSLDHYSQFLKKAIRGGVSMVQLREKGRDLDLIKRKACHLQKILKPHNIPLIINDFVELAADINAEGVHIGQQDMTVDQARKILGPDKIIGLSIESIDELHRANHQDGISYVTASAVFPSKTKPDCKTIWGIEGLKALVNSSTHPITAIGGINLENATTIFDARVDGIAVIGAIHQAHDPEFASSQLRNASLDPQLSSSTKLGV